MCLFCTHSIPLSFTFPNKGGLGVFPFARWEKGAKTGRQTAAVWPPLCPCSLSPHPWVLRCLWPWLCIPSWDSPWPVGLWQMCPSRLDKRLHTGTCSSCCSLEPPKPHGRGWVTPPGGERPRGTQMSQPSGSQDQPTCWQPNMSLRTSKVIQPLTGPQPTLATGERAQQSPAGLAQIRIAPPTLRTVSSAKELLP